MPAAPSAAAQRIRGLDGLRGIAILMVVFGHVWNGIDPHGDRLFASTTNRSGGGFLGVQLFFVLSGFLITSLLLRERERTGRISLKAFWVRRARRLLPALFIVCAAYAAYAFVALPPGQQQGAYGSVVRAVTYTQDWPQLWSSLDNNGWLSHSWSLAIEEQFYLLWPLLLLLAIRWGRNAVAGVAAVGIVVDLILQFTLTDPGEFAMHWDALMAGCLLAAWPWALRVPPIVGWAAIGVLAAGVGHLPDKGPEVMTASVAVCAVVLVFALQASWMNAKVLRYFGAISYGLYLWHAVLLRFGWPLYLTLPASLLIADLSFRYVERRFLSKGHAVAGGIEGPARAPGAPATVAESTG
jgi:peptidoglycan/LPS O-acetylase OafA/YrhL